MTLLDGTTAAIKRANPRCEAQLRTELLSFIRIQDHEILKKLHVVRSMLNVDRKLLDRGAAAVPPYLASLPLGYKLSDVVSALARVREKFGDHNVAVVACDAIGALKRIHSAGVLHHDLSANNIVLDRKSEYAVVIDLGSSAPLETPADLKIGTKSFLAPTTIQGGGARTGVSADLYSLGVICAYAARLGMPDTYKKDTEEGDIMTAKIVDAANGYKALLDGVGADLAGAIRSLLDVATDVPDYAAFAQGFANMAPFTGMHLNWHVAERMAVDAREIGGAGVPIDGAWLSRLPGADNPGTCTRTGRHIIHCIAH
jgi:Protein kinase domain